MPRNKNRKRRGNGGAVVPYARMRPQISDWQIGGITVASNGTPTTGATSATSWNLSSGIAAASDTPQGFLGAQIIPAPGTVTTGVGRLRIDKIKGMVALGAPATAGDHSFAVGIFVSELNTAQSAWDMRNPLSPSDAARDDWFFLQGATAELPQDGSATANAILAIELELANPLIIGGGQGLMVVAAYNGAVTAQFYTAFRTLVSAVA